MRVREGEGKCELTAPFPHLRTAEEVHQKLLDQAKEVRLAEIAKKQAAIDLRKEQEAKKKAELAESMRI